jgi:hypothetical protein
MCTVKIQDLGINVRLSIVENQSEEAQNMFANLAWVCSTYKKEHDATCFTCKKEKLVNSLRAFRSSNMGTRRGKGLWKPAPFRFQLIGVFSKGNDASSDEYKIGQNYDHRDTWDGCTSRLEQHFEKTSRVEKDSVKGLVKLIS